MRRTNLDKLFNNLIDQYHYLEYTELVGEHLKCIVFVEERPIVCLAFSSAPYRILHRDRFIGLFLEMIEKNLHFLAYNSWFFILPWVHVPLLVSNLLAKYARGISEDWLTLNKYPVFWLKTFVDIYLFKGICYQAANWIFLGNTSGRGKYNKTQKQLTLIKVMYGFPLVKNFREKLCQ